MVGEGGSFIPSRQSVSLFDPRGQKVTLKDTWMASGRGGLCVLGSEVTAGMLGKEEWGEG